MNIPLYEQLNNKRIRITSGSHEGVTFSYSNVVLFCDIDGICQYKFDTDIDDCCGFDTLANLILYDLLTKAIDAE